MRGVRRTVLGGLTAAVLSTALGCSGGTNQPRGCESDAQCNTPNICRVSDGVCIAPTVVSTVSVRKSGAGSGTITSTPAGISCGATCSGTFPVGSKLTLTATPDAGSAVVSFSLGCTSATASCDITPQDTSPIIVQVNFGSDGGTAPALCNGFGFCWENPKPAGNTLRDVAVVAPGELWAVGDSGTILHRVGGAFTLVPTGLSANLYGLWGSTSDLYAVGAAGTILHGVNGTFSAESSGIGSDLLDVWGSSGTVFAVGSGGKILRRAPAGTWMPDTSNTTKDLVGIWGSSTSDIWAVGAQGTTVRNTGSGWVPSVNQPIFASNNLRGIAGGVGSLPYTIDSLGGIYSYSGVWSLSSKIGLDDYFGVNVVAGTPYVVGLSTGGTVLHYDSAGAKWVRDITATDTFRAIAGSAANDLWTVGDAGAIWTNDGTAWQLRSSGNTTIFNSVWASDPQNAWMVGAGGAVLHYNGSYLASVNIGSGNVLTGVWGSAPGDVWVVGTGGVIRHYDGSVWSTSPSGTAQSLRAVFGLGPSRAFAVGDAGIALTWDGSKWNTVVSGGGVNLKAVWASSASDIWAVGELGTVLHSTGSSFAAVANPPATSATLGGIWGSSASDFWVTAGSQIFHYQAGTFTASPLPSGVSGLTGIFGISASEVYAVGQGGTLIRYNGTSWQQVSTGAGPDLLALFAAGRRLWVIGNSGSILRKDI